MTPIKSMIGARNSSMKRLICTALMVLTGATAVHATETTLTISGKPTPNGSITLSATVTGKHLTLEWDGGKKGRKGSALRIHNGNTELYSESVTPDNSVPGGVFAPDKPSPPQYNYSDSSTISYILKLPRGMMSYDLWASFDGDNIWGDPSSSAHSTITSRPTVTAATYLITE